MHPRRLAGTAMLSLLLAACAPVAPWQHEVLAKPQMALDALPQHASLRAHRDASRESGSHLTGSEGGGCGCY